MTLFIENVLEDGVISPNTVVITYPSPSSTVSKGSDSSTRSLNGLLISEATLSTGVKWGPILNDVTNLQDLASLLGSSSMWTWIGASTMCWKGTDPLKTSIEFYLINYRPQLGIEEKLKELNYLTSLVKDGVASVFVHGGYSAEVLETNSSMFNNRITSSGALVKQKGLSEFGQTKSGLGTLSITLGNKLTLNRMLISSLDITPSTVEVPDKRALYYRVSMSLIGAQPLLSTDIDNMYRNIVSSSASFSDSVAGEGANGGGGSSW